MTGKRGEGQHIDLSLLDVQAAALANQGMNYLVSGRVPTRLGNAHPVLKNHIHHMIRHSNSEYSQNIVPYQSFEAKDGHFVIALGNDAQYQKMCTVIGLPELGQHPKYSTNAK